MPQTVQGVLLCLYCSFWMVSGVFGITSLASAVILTIVWAVRHTCSSHGNAWRKPVSVSLRLFSVSCPITFLLTLFGGPHWPLEEWFEFYVWFCFFTTPVTLVGSWIIGPQKYPQAIQRDDVEPSQDEGDAEGDR